ncbi:hypothetical protein DB88DRAFT_440663 [Papiliotrema laurentii]|uniref:ATP12-domain-containing protein n=1 Tax=Papiliotrema laurentii TaxID=5418 RepID=A0AAD9CX44_PAPLA|nr:hypothetical protein DB88DRAFT_440663 [Papiliotrema laurentii]
MSRAAGPSKLAAVAQRTHCFGAQRSLSTSRVSFAEVKAGPAISQTNRAEMTLRRFWKNVHVKEDESGNYLVTLDKRNLKTPSGTKLVIPREKRVMAALIANEWENQDEVLKQHALPLTSLASRALDGMNDATIRAGVIDALFKYFETDTILFPDEKPRALVRMQKEHWDPLFAWAEKELGVKLKLADGFAPAQQDQESIDKLRQIVEGFDIWQLAAFERAVYASKSFMIGLALVQGRLSADDAAHAAQVEVRSQIEQWGEVEDSHDVDYQDIRRALGSVACALVSL